AGVVLDADGRRLLAVAEDPALALRHDAVAVLAGGEAVAPVAERALGELHDVALVHEGDAAASVAQRVLDRRAHQALRSLARDGLDPDAAGLGEADLLDPHLLLEEGDDLAGLGRLRRPFHAGVDVLRVLAEDHHVDLLGAFHRAGNAREVAHRPETDVEIEHLP